MRIRRFNHLLLLTALGVAWAGTAAGQDRCELFADPGRTGTKATMNAPAVTATKATGSPLGSSWANTSERFTSSQLGSLNNKTTSVRVVASQSDMALYLLDSAQFSGKGEVLHCKKGRTCTFDLGSRMNDKTSSAICQREYFRKSKFTNTNVDPVLAYFTWLANPIIDTANVSDAVDAVAQELISGVDGIDAYRSSNSSDGMSLWSRTTWITNFDHCKRFGHSDCQTSADKFKDLFRISKRFEIDVDDTFVDLNPFMDDDYVVQADWYVRPVITDHDGSASTPNELRFWWATRDIWIEEGDLHGRISDIVVPIIRGVDIQAQLRAGILLLMSGSGCSSCVDGRERLQFSVHSDGNIGKPVWAENFEMDVTHPQLALNATRDATYPD